MNEETLLACPFCGTGVAPPAPSHCPKCSKSFRDMTLQEYVPDQTLNEQLASVVTGVRQQQEQINGRTNWWKVEDKVNIKNETNVHWDNEFATEYQRANDMTVEDSLKEIEEYNALVEGEFDEDKWRAFIAKYKKRKHKHELNLPVDDMFLKKLQENRDKKEEGKGNGGGVGVKNNPFKQAEKKRVEPKETEKLPNPPPKAKFAAKKPVQPKAKFIASKSGNARKEMGKYMDKKNNQRKKLW
eukprot:augustus_masked-scaffold_9-processed-gene-9.46-mRNA-1 protein AED:0.10 eAED:0.10 QI:0/-1/0/1/-1/1/1/0/241